MLNKNRFLSLLLALILTLAASGCAKKETPAASTEPASASTDRPTLSAAELAELYEQNAGAEINDPGDLVLTATGVASDEIVATVDGNSAPAELLAYQVGYIGAFLSYLFESEGLGEFDIHGTKLDGRDAAEFVRTEAFDMVKQQLVLENLCRENGIKITPAIQMQMDDAYEEEEDYYGMDGFIAEIHKLGLTEEGYDRVTRAGYLYPMLLDAYADPESPLYADDETIAAYAAEQGYITADHILIATIDVSTREALPADEIAERHEHAEKLLWQLRDSRDPIALFKTLADEYSEDPGRATNPEGYTFGANTMVDSFDSAARALGENEYSDLVESEYGYHIILRRPLDAAAAAEAVRDDYYDQVFTAEVDKAELALTPVGESIDVVALFDALDAAQGDMFRR